MALKISALNHKPASNPMNEIAKPKIVEWDENNIPISVQFNDPYYSRHDGQAETRHVFLGGNQLPERWADQEYFTIAELGFGTGLNFIETYALWLETRQPEQHLSFMSCEAFPLTKTDITQALAHWGNRQHISDRLIAQLPETYPEQGEIKLHLDPQTILILLIGDANKTLQNWNGQADAWFLDGFSPDKNGDLWSAEMMQLVYDHTPHQGTCATYTAAGWVRRNLEQAGFTVSRVKGHGRKRHMTTARKLET